MHGEYRRIGGKSQRFPMGTSAKLADDDVRDVIEAVFRVLGKAGG